MFYSECLLSIVKLFVITPNWSQFTNQVKSEGALFRGITVKGNECKIMTLFWKVQNHLRLCADHLKSQSSSLKCVVVCNKTKWKKDKVVWMFLQELEKKHNKQMPTASKLMTFSVKTTPKQNQQQRKTGMSKATRLKSPNLAVEWLRSPGSRLQRRQQRQSENTAAAFCSPFQSKIRLKGYAWFDFYLSSGVARLVEKKPGIGASGLTATWVVLWSRRAPGPCWRHATQLL